MRPKHNVVAAVERRAVAVYELFCDKTSELKFSLVHAIAVNLPVFLHGKAARSTQYVPLINYPVILAAGLKGSACHADDQIFRRNIFLRPPGWLLAFSNRAQDGNKLCPVFPAQRVAGSCAVLLSTIHGKADKDSREARLDGG